METQALDRKITSLRSELRIKFAYGIVALGELYAVADNTSLFEKVLMRTDRGMLIACEHGLSHIAEEDDLLLASPSERKDIIHRAKLLLASQ